MNKGLEKIMEFEGQEIKVITDKGEVLINLSNSCRVLGITQKKNNGNLKIRWSNLKEKLNTICSEGQKVEPQYVEEIKYILMD